MAPENTMAAFRAAVVLGADGIELDARMTVDGHVVVHHDRTLERTTTGEGVLSDRTLRELEALDAGVRFGEAFAGERIPRLDDVFDAFGQLLLINVHFSNYENPRDGLPEAVVGLIRRHRLEHRVLCSSFDPRGLIMMRRLAPDVGSALLVWHLQNRVQRKLFEQFAPCHAYHPQDPLVTRQGIEREHARGRPVHAWTVNDRTRIAELAAWGMDGLITDVPEIAREVLDAAAR